VAFLSGAIRRPDRRAPTLNQMGPLMDGITAGFAGNQARCGD
jgi:hypothetical protein